MDNNAPNALSLLRDELDEKLSNVDLDTKPLQRAHSSFHIARDYLARLKRIKPEQFEDEASEIDFHRSISPAFYAYLIYFHRVFQLESSLFPSEALRTKRLRKEMKSIEEYIQDNLWPYRYYKTDDDAMDRELFLSQPAGMAANLEEAEILADPGCGTAMTFKFARFMAYERLNTYLAQQLDRKRDEPTPQEGVKLKWTDKKIYLQELTYALAYSNSINNGDVTVKTVARMFETAFDIDLSNTYRSRQEMYSRKDVAMYMNLLITRFKAGMDEADDRSNVR